MEEEFVSFVSGYSISNYGRVRIDRNGKFMKLQDRDKRKLGYLSVYVSGKNYSIHRLVASYFVKNEKPDEYDVVNHIDNNPSNNHFHNLEWCTQKMNIAHSYEQGNHTSIWNDGYKNHQVKANTPSHIKRKKNGDLPLGVFIIKLKNGIRYHARFSNSNTGYIGLGSYSTIYEAFQKVKQKFFEVYGKYPDCPEPEYEEPKEIVNCKCKLNWEKVREIRNSGLNEIQVSEKYGIARTTARGVLNHSSWKEKTNAIP